MRDFIPSKTLSESSLVALAQKMETSHNDSDHAKVADMLRSCAKEFERLRKERAEILALRGIDFGPLEPCKKCATLETMSLWMIAKIKELEDRPPDETVSAPLIVRCDHCGTDYTPTHGFCAYCGKYPSVKAREKL